jgi:hypothetical protein
MSEPTRLQARQLRAAWPPTPFMVYLKLRIFEKFRGTSHSTPSTMGWRRFPTAPKEVVHGLNAECAGLYGSADPHRPLVVCGLSQRIRKRRDDKFWFCQGPAAQITRSHVLLHYLNAKLRVAREEVWEGKDLGGVRVLLSGPL